MIDQALTLANFKLGCLRQVKIAWVQVDPLIRHLILMTSNLVSTKVEEDLWQHS